MIGQACEFDYSGAQACKALREEGYRVILVNSNPATIMTDPEMADATYIEPVHWTAVERIIEKERPDALTADDGRADGSELCAGPRARGRAREIQRRVDRGVAKPSTWPKTGTCFGKAMTRSAWKVQERRSRIRWKRRSRSRSGDRISDDHPAVFHAGRDRRWYRL